MLGYQGYRIIYLSVKEKYRRFQTKIPENIKAFLEKQKGGEGGSKGRKEGVCEELRQLLPTPRSSPPSHAAGLLLTHPVPPTEARGQGCSGGFEVTERRTGRKKNQMGREGTIT